ncbi:conserved hypothetical protein [Methylocella silvestris BL2]|uniref:DUF2948 domain-containing protein n=1 Tax=Methylocella silvestris (strain DSM 15510 / CIP 108128 / LMG 27833 / NCIMB 13906 / BL2) TaxID=395965 RepID=B8ESQ8_METSB|nr:DUF2948 family protein [Methylocella silvestris]ACK50393.1 conserved hypothetical protein [Methylocella silvestris BL2]
MSEILAPTELRLIALDKEDLDIVSANLQDALVLVGEMALLPDTRQFAFLASRFDWVKAASGPLERCRAGLHFDGVVGAAYSGFSLSDKTRILNLLRICFRETQAPAGEVDLIFSGGCAVRLKVERLEARLRDRGERWKSCGLPGHPCQDERRDETHSEGQDALG